MNVNIVFLILLILLVLLFFTGTIVITPYLFVLLLVGIAAALYISRSNL